MSKNHSLRSPWDAKRATSCVSVIYDERDGAGERDNGTWDPFHPLRFSTSKAIGDIDIREY